MRLECELVWNDKWRKVVEVIADIQTDCVHKDHNNDNAPRRDKKVGDGFSDKQRKRVRLHYT